MSFLPLRARGARDVSFSLLTKTYCTTCSGGLQAGDFARQCAHLKMAATKHLGYATAFSHARYRNFVT
jgi:hypothetical protein